MARRKRKKQKQKKKKPPKKPKLKGRARRVAKAPDWVKRHWGKPKNMLRRYRKHFHVNYECAIAELHTLGVRFDRLYLERLRDQLTRQPDPFKKKTPIDAWEFFPDGDLDGYGIDYDENYSFIAGYTAGGAPFGITWEEQEEIDAREEAEAILFDNFDPGVAVDDDDPDVDEGMPN